MKAKVRVRVIKRATGETIFDRMYAPSDVAAIKKNYDQKLSIKNRYIVKLGE